MMERDEMFFATCPDFDERLNYSARVEDIKTDLVKGFLYTVDSKLYDQRRDMSREDLLESMNLIAGPPEMRMPLNVSLLFFNDKPERFFPYSYIEIVYKPDPTGNGMEEMIFKGPLYIQLKNALRYIRNSVVKEKIEKFPDRAEALRYFNYPYDAIEEALSNAVRHKSYQIREPITVTITKEEIEIMSNPGPDDSISDEDLKAGRLISSKNRNRRIGDYLKQLGLAKDRNRGVPTIINSMERNGSPAPIFMTDPIRAAFVVVLPIHPSFLEREEKEGNPRWRDGSVKAKILNTLADYGALSITEIAQHLGCSRTAVGLLAAISDLLAEERIEYSGEKLRLKVNL